MMPPHAKTETPQHLRWFGHTDRGKIRRNNEDAFLCLQFDAQEVRYLGKIGDASTDSNDFVFAVSDGMGGAMAGEFASRIAVDKITRLLPRSFRQAAIGIEAGFADVLMELFDQIHRALMFVGGSYEECSGMGATLSMCWFTSGWMYFGHIGDSRLYYLPAREGGIKQITHDDTHVGWLFRNGKINEREARNHPRRNILQKALGAGHQFVDPQVGAVACEPGDLFLLCTDGVVDGLFDQQFVDFLRSPESPDVLAHPAKYLVDAAVERSGRDNSTALVIEVVSESGLSTPPL
jgi:serine/threonine protein phosphatase PrpC